MHAFNRIFIGTVVFTSMLCLQVFAGECPTPTLPDKLYKDDKACLAILDERFASYSLDIEFLSDRNYLLSTYDYADQQLVIDTFYIKYCNLVAEPRWNLSVDEQKARLEVAREKLYTRVPFPAPIVDTRNLSSLQPLLKFNLASNSINHEFLFQYFSMNNGVQAVLASNHADEPETTGKYLRDPPFLITRGNKHFVIVSSVRYEKDLLSEIRRLKVKAPQFDFVAYAPYKGNPYHAIMMATWVCYSVAKEALENAQKFVKSDSYIWSCPSEGDNC